MRGSGFLCGALLVLACFGQAQAAPEVKTPSICLSQPQSADCAAQTRRALNDRMTHLYRLELQKVMGTYTERRLDHAQNLGGAGRMRNASSATARPIGGMPPGARGRMTACRA